jgi:hypothetical protein
MRKLYTFILFTAIMAISGSVLAQNFGILLVEDFETGALPTDWTRSQALGSDGWTFGVTGYSSSFWTIPASIDNSQFTVSNDDQCDCDMSDDQLNSPTLDLTNFDSAIFLFDRFYDGLWDSEAYFQISYDGGATWLYLALTADPAWVEDGLILPSVITVDNVDYTFTNNMKIGFLHVDAGVWASGFAVDNVIIAGYNNPCDDVISIAGCGAPQTVSLSGQGVLDFNFTGPCGFGVPGAEQLYSFTPATSGIYTLDVTATTGASWLDYMFKPASLGCDSLNWNCLDDVIESGSYGMNLTGGVEYLILVDNEFSDLETQTFSISCPCTYTSQGNPAESESCGADLNGGCNNDPNPETYEPIACGASISGTLWADGGNRDTDWFELVVTETTDIEIDYSGGMPINAILIDNCTDFTVFGQATSTACGSGSITYTAAPGTYVLAIVPTAFEAYPCGSGSANQYDITVTYCNAPSNDNVCNPIGLNAGMNGPFSNVNATAQSGEPVPGPGTGGNTCQAQDGWCSLDLNVDNSIWFTFVAPSSGSVTISTDGSDEDTQVAVYSASSCGALLSGQGVLVGANDDNPNYQITLFSSLLNLCGLTPGNTYYVQVDGYLGAAGNILVELTNNTLTAGFSSSVTNLNVAFTDASLSSGTIVSWAWDFGDQSGTSSTQNPSYSYAAGGTYNVCLTVTDDLGCESTFCQNVTVTDIPTSIAEAVENGMSVYPNPSNGEFIVEINGVEAYVQLVVLDVTGRAVYTEGVVLNGSFRKTINVEVARGTYFLQINTAEGMVTRKLQID